MYNLLTLGKALEQTIDGDKKAIPFSTSIGKVGQNVFHVTEEFKVQRTGSHEHYIPDIVLFVNGIPLVVIECKLPDLKEPAASYFPAFTQPTGRWIRLFYAYSQILLSIPPTMHRTLQPRLKKILVEMGRTVWVPGNGATISAGDCSGKESTISGGTKAKVVCRAIRLCAKNILTAAELEQVVTEQDKYLYCICRPERLLDLAFNFVVYDSGTKK